jgi:hypothetical protein
VTNLSVDCMSPEVKNWCINSLVLGIDIKEVWSFI